MANITIPSNITERGLLQPSDLLNLYDFINTGTWNTLTVGTLDVTGVATIATLDVTGAAAFSYGPNYGADTGTAANTIVVTLSSSISAYANNLRVWTKPAYSNTGAATINVNALGAKNIYGMNGTALQGGEYVANGMAEFIYDTRLDSGAGGFYLISSQGTLQVSPASASNQAVALGQVLNTDPVGASNGSSGGTQVIATSGTFTAPSNGILFIYALGSSASAVLNGSALSTSLSGLTLFSANISTSSVSVFPAYLPMNAGQTTTITASVSASSNSNIAVSVYGFFIPFP